MVMTHQAYGQLVESHGHHSYSHRGAVDLSEAEERADFERAWPRWSGPV